jgi:gluconolactonase
LKVFDLSFYRVVPALSKAEIIGEGFTWSEGLVWLKKEEVLLFSDVPGNMIYTWIEADRMELFLGLYGYQETHWRKG